MSGFAFCPTKNKVVARLGYSRDNRGHQMALILKIRANCKVPTLKTIIFYLYFFMPRLQWDWPGFLLEGLDLFRLHTHTHTSQFSQINLLTIDLHVQFSDLDPTKVNGVEKLHTILARIWVNMRKTLSGKQCFIKTKMEDKSYFFSCCKLRI